MLENAAIAGAAAVVAYLSANLTSIHVSGTAALSVPMIALGLSALHKFLADTRI